MQEAQVIVVRHGETEWNLEGRWQGHEDSPLTPNGHFQAQAAAKVISGFHPKRLYSSDLGRALQTSQYIARETGLEIQQEPSLRERKLGIFQGLTTQQMKASYPDIYEEFRNAGAGYRVPEGESIQDRFDRSIAGFNKLARNLNGESVVIVTHGGVLDGLFRYVIGLPLTAPRHFKIRNCSLNHFSFDGETENWRLDTFGEIAHLRTMQTLDDL